MLVAAEHFDLIPLPYYTNNAITRLAAAKHTHACFTADVYKLIKCVYLLITVMSRTKGTIMLMSWEWLIKSQPPPEKTDSPVSYFNCHLQEHEMKYWLGSGCRWGLTLHSMIWWHVDLVISVFRLFCSVERCYTFYSLTILIYLLCICFHMSC